MGILHYKNCKNNILINLVNILTVDFSIKDYIISIFFVIETIFFIFNNRIMLKKEQILKSVDEKDQINNKEKQILNFLSILEFIISKFSFCLFILKDISCFVIANITYYYIK